MPPPPDRHLLFLYMVPGTGHQKAAESIIEAASHLDPRTQCVSLDAGYQTFPLLGSVVNRMYLQMLKSAPFIWEYLYDNPDVEEVTRDMRELLRLAGSLKIKRLLKKYKPAAVVCTQAMPAIAMAAEKRKGQLKAPLISVITDFAVHTYWLHPEVDLYLVGHEDVKQEMIRRGIAAQRIRVTGIPILPKFGESVDVVSARHKLRLSPHKKTLLIMGGGHGLGPLDEMVEAIKTIPLHLQTIVVCGKNRRVHKKILKVIGDDPDFHVFGYVKDTSALMSAADILVTKPGGLTCSEALAKQLPLILTSPIPGQEERNVRFLTKHHVARLVDTPEDLIHAVVDLVRHPKKIESMRQRSRLISKPHSAWEAARVIFDVVNQRGSFAQRIS
ncbi:MAG: Processive diacylglycerol beta-glucosyltransferase [Elusimicrobia bacterium]|nr:Processive diacylglycerol beta-glucosyltransferase [Elusimicrobiota bacterium]